MTASVDKQMEDKAAIMSYANYGIDVEDIVRIVGKALGKEGPRRALAYLRKFGYEREDVEQQAMLQAYRYSPNFDADRGAPSTYLYKVVGSTIHHLMDHHTRIGQAEVTDATCSLDKAIGDGGDSFMELIGGEDFPELPADYAYIQEAIALRYGADTAQAFVNVYAYGAKTREEAERLGINYKALAQRFNMCRQHLRYVLKETEDYVSCA